MKSDGKRSFLSAAASRVSEVLSNARTAVYDFFTVKMWSTELHKMNGLRKRAVKVVRVMALVFVGFQKDECSLHASSLTFISMLSLVPVLALGLSLARVSGYSETMRTEAKAFVRDMVADVSVPAAAGDAERTAVQAPPAGVITVERVEKLIDTVFDRINSFNYGALGGLGLIFLFWTVIEMIGKVESTFNKVWGVDEDRPLFRKFTDYLCVIIIVPTLVFAAASIPVVNVLRTHVASFGNDLLISRLMGVNVFRAAWSLLLFSLAFCFLLRFTPNTRVKFSAGMYGGFITAIGFAVWMKICMAAQIGVAKYSAFFGSFALLPIMLFWVYISWQILLVGAEVSYAVQNADSYGRESGWSNASMRSRVMLAVAMLHELSNMISRGQGILDLSEFNRKYGISFRLLRSVAADLVSAGIVVEAAQRPDCFAACRNVGDMRVSDVAGIFMEHGTGPEALGIHSLPTSSAVGDAADCGNVGVLGRRIADIPENARSCAEAADA